MPKLESNLNGAMIRPSATDSAKCTASAASITPALGAACDRTSGRITRAADRCDRGWERAGSEFLRGQEKAIAAAFRAEPAQQERRGDRSRLDRQRDLHQVLPVEGNQVPVNRVREPAVDVLVFRIGIP